MNISDQETIDEKVSNDALYTFIGALAFAVGFTTLIWLLGPNLNHFTDTLLPSQGAWWYPWKLPIRDSAAMVITWAFYLANQFTVWGLIRWAQSNLTTQKIKPTGALTKYNLAALGVTVLFTFLHLIQTHLWFDALAQDTPILTSQGSVIIMLAIVLVIENPRRGLIFGKRAGAPFTSQVSAWFRHNHMYVISWALVYTFWFHPMATDPQLITGFFYMFLLFTQMSLAYTWIHIDKRWVIFLESFVAIHGAIVAFYNTQFFGSADMWPMFLSGFAFMFFFTYMYALHAPRWIYGGMTVVYLVFLVWLYIPSPFGYGRNLTNLTRLEMLWIPLTLYGLSAVFSLIGYLNFRNKN